MPNKHFDIFHICYWILEHRQQKRQAAEAVVQDTKVEEMKKKMKNKLTVTKNVWMEKKFNNGVERMAEKERLESRKLLLLLVLVETVFWFVVMSPNCRYSLVKKLKSIKDLLILFLINCASVKTFLIQFVFFSVQTCTAVQLYCKFDNCWLENFFFGDFFLSSLFHAFSIDSIFCNIFHSCFAMEVNFFFVAGIF